MDLDLVHHFLIGHDHLAVSDHQVAMVVEEVVAGDIEGEHLGDLEAQVDLGGIVEEVDQEAAEADLAAKC